MNDFERANESIHPVEHQWHYPILTKAGWVPITKVKVGFVRSYKYEHEQHPNISIVCTTGSNADYWRAYEIDSKDEIGGDYHSKLSSFVGNLKEVPE